MAHENQQRKESNAVATLYERLGKVEQEQARQTAAQQAMQSDIHALSDSFKSFRQEVMDSIAQLTRERRVAWSPIIAAVSVVLLILGAFVNSITGTINTAVGSNTKKLDKLSNIVFEHASDGHPHTQVEQLKALEQSIKTEAARHSRSNERTESRLIDRISRLEDSTNTRFQQLLERYFPASK